MLTSIRPFNGMAFRSLLIPALIALAFAGLEPALSNGDSTAYAADCYGYVRSTSIGNSNGYAFGEAEGFCNPASQELLSIDLYVNGSIYESRYDSGFKSYFYASLTDYVCGYVQFGYYFAGTSSVNPGLTNC